MITPRFSCSQTPESVIISIYCPSIRAADVEIHVDGTFVSVYVNPYFLRLNFSNSLVEDDASSAQYDPSTGYLTLTLTKETPGQEFSDLDLLTKLLAPRPTRAPPTIEVISDIQPTSSEDELVDKLDDLTLEHQEILHASRNDWQLPQGEPERPIDISVQKNYGFLDLYSGFFEHVAHTENEVNELGADTETCTLSERRKRRLEHEDKKFDEEHYMADYADDGYLEELLEWQHPHTKPSEAFEYTEDEKLMMLRLPRREYLISPIQAHDLYLTLVSLLFSYAYESRMNQCDPTPESAWTICSLTPAFSALDPPHSTALSTSRLASFEEEELVEVTVASYRRSLAFPLYRYFAFAEACRQDVAQFLLRGKRTVVRCLLEMKNILDHHEVYYVYSKIWVDDFCVWCQTYASDNALMELGNVVSRTRVPKSSIGWDLDALEAATRLIEEREADSDDESEANSTAPL